MTDSRSVTTVRKLIFGAMAVASLAILPTSAQAVPIDYSMEKTANGWKVYDVMVGGVSLVANYRTEFNHAVRESGIDGLIKTLNAKNRSAESKK